MPKKRLGQHFLSDRNILERIVDFSGVGPDHTVVEIGPGRGALTEVLAERVHQVIAVEVDPDLLPHLTRTVRKNVELVEQDALTLDFLNLVKTPYVIVANLPYNISTPLMGRFLNARLAISGVTVLVQKEVADRILSRPGSKDYGPLSVGVQYFADVEKGFVVHAAAFSPEPNVDSRLIRFRWRPNVAAAPGFEAFVQNVFRSRRKKLVNNLTQVDRDTLARALEGLKLDANVRAEDLSVDQLHSLYRTLA